MRILEDCNIKLSSVVKVIQAVRQLLLLLIGKFTLDDINSVYHGKLSASPEELLEACTGFVEEHHIYLLQMIRKDIDQTQTLVDDLSERIKRLLSKYENVLELLREIPGFSTKVVEDLVSEIGLDMSHFPSEKHLSSRAGLSPGNNESAGKKAHESLTETNR